MNATPTTIPELAQMLAVNSARAVAMFDIAHGITTAADLTRLDGDAAVLRQTLADQLDTAVRLCRAAGLDWFDRLAAYDQALAADATPPPAFCPCGDEAALAGPLCGSCAVAQFERAMDAG